MVNIQFTVILIKWFYNVFRLGIVTRIDYRYASCVIFDLK